MNGIFDKNSHRQPNETLENKVARAQGAKTWLDVLIDVGKSVVGMEKTASAKPQAEVKKFADKEQSVINGTHYFGGARKFADTKDRKMEYIIASGKEIIGKKMGELKLSGAKALFLKADIKEWNEETNQPSEGALYFDIAFQAPTGDPRTVSASIQINKGQPQEPSYFSDGVGNKYAFDAKGIDDLLQGTDFEVMQNPKVDRENTFFENPGHLAGSRGSMPIKVAGREGMIRRASMGKVATAREGLIRKISEEEKGKDASMKGVFGAGRFRFRKKTPSDVGGNMPYHRENNIPYEQFGANENDPDALAGKVCPVASVRRKAGPTNDRVDVRVPVESTMPTRPEDREPGKEYPDKMKGTIIYLSVDNVSTEELTDEAKKKYRDQASQYGAILEEQYDAETRKYWLTVDTKGKEKSASVQRKAEVDSDILSVEQHLDVNEFRDFQNLQKVSDDMWTVIRQREKINEGKGLPSYTNIDYSDIKLVDKQIQDYVDQAKQRAGKGEEAEVNKGDVEIREPEVPKKEEKPEGKPEEELPESVLTPEKGKGKKPGEGLPEFASAKTRFTKKAWDPSIPEGMYKCPGCGKIKSKDEMGPYDLCEDCQANGGVPPNAGAMRAPVKKDKPQEDVDAYGKMASADVEIKDMTKKAVTSWDYPQVCENCKMLITPTGYDELTEIDMHRKPFCGAIGKGKGIGFEFAHFRECKGYDPMSKEVGQEVEVNVYKKPYQLHRVSGQTERLMVKKASMDKLVAERKAHATEQMRRMAEEAEGTAHPECAKCKDCIPAGEGHVAHDYCKVWQTACSNVVVMPSGACVPVSIASQSSETQQKTTGQFNRGQEV